MDEVIEQVVEQVEETVVPEEVEEVVENNEEHEEVEEEFDPDKLFDDEEFVVEGYDLSKYKDSIDINSDIVQSYASEMKSKGFTQEQIEWFIDKQLEIDDEEPEQSKPTAKEIKERLNASLTSEEKRNYKAVNSFIGSVIDGTELEMFKTEIIQNPNLVKLFNLVYKNSIGNNKTVNSISKTNERQIKSVSFEDAHEQIKECLRNKGDVKELVKELKGKVNDKESFGSLLQVLNLK